VPDLEAPIVTSIPEDAESPKEPDESEIRSDSPIESIRALVSAELAESVRPNVAWLAAEVGARHGDAVLGILFYGSCLRKETDEGLLDFWVVVDDYAAAYTHRGHAFVNHLAPPNVFYIEREHDGATLRTKYGVLDRKAFQKGTSLGAWHPYIWARFAQPARLLECRDEDARIFLTECVAEAIVAMVGRLVCFLPAQGGRIRFSLPAFWQEAFRRTYDSERRPESDDYIRGLYAADEARYDAAASLALPILAERGHFESAIEHPRAFEVELQARDQSRQRLRWHMMRPFARALGLMRLFKTAWTFGDWVPYVLWKLERHTGRRIETTERQRRHPLIFGWPIILPLLFKRNLR
jgi:hypothetical protein